MKKKVERNCMMQTHMVDCKKGAKYSKGWINKCCNFCRCKCESRCMNDHTKCGLMVEVYEDGTAEEVGT